MKACSLAMLLLLASSSTLAQNPYTDQQVIAYAKSIDVQTLDPSLPSQSLEDWLQSGPPHAHILRWEVEDTCQNKPDDPNIDYPLCARVWSRRGGQISEIYIQVGTSNKGIVGPPKLYEGVAVMETAEIVTGVSQRLADIPGLLDKPAFTGGVRKLYEEIVARHPIGIPTGQDKAAIWPLLSKRLAGQLQTAQACQEDYFRQLPTADSTRKPAWLKTDIFSGDGKRAYSVDSVLRGKEPQEDGSFLVDVGLYVPVIKPGNKHNAKPGPPEHGWRVSAKVITEDGQFVVDDIRIFDAFTNGWNSTDDPSHLLSDSFTGCDGPHWTGLASTNK